MLTSTVTFLLCFCIFFYGLLSSKLSFMNDSNYLLDRKDSKLFSPQNRKSNLKTSMKKLKHNENFNQQILRRNEKKFNGSKRLIGLASNTNYSIDIPIVYVYYIDVDSCILNKNKIYF